MLSLSLFHVYTPSRLSAHHAGVHRRRQPRSPLCWLDTRPSQCGRSHPTTKLCPHCSRGRALMRMPSPPSPWAYGESASRRSADISYVGSFEGGVSQVPRWPALCQTSRPSYAVSQCQGYHASAAGERLLPDIVLGTAFRPPLCCLLLRGSADPDIAPRLFMAAAPQPKAVSNTELTSLNVFC